MNCSKCNTKLSTRIETKEITQKDLCNHFWYYCGCTYEVSRIETREIKVCETCKCEVFECEQCKIYYPKELLRGRKCTKLCYGFQSEKEYLLVELKRYHIKHNNPNTKDSVYEFDEVNWQWNLIREYGNCAICTKRYITTKDEFVREMNQKMPVRYPTCADCRGIIYNPFKLNQFLKPFYIPKEANEYCNYICQTGGRYYYPDQMSSELIDKLIECQASAQLFSLMENVHSMVPFRLFFDIEDDEKILPSTKEIVQTIKSHIETLTSQKLDYAYISLVNNRKSKHRRHIIFQKIMLKLSQYRELLKQLPAYVDKSVHGLRLIYSSKVKTFELPNQRKGESKGKAFDSQAGIYIPEGITPKQAGSLTKRDLATHFKMSSILNTQGCTELNSIIETTKKGANGDYCQPEITSTLQAAIFKIYESKKDLKNYFNLEFTVDGNILLRRIKPSLCFLCERVHEKVDLYMIIVKQELRLKCWRMGGKSSLLVDRIPKKALKDYVVVGGLK